MVKGEAQRRSPAPAGKPDLSGGYDYLKEIVDVAKKNGWDIESLGLVRRDLPAGPARPLTKKEFQEISRRVKNVLKRYGRALKRPVPLELEKSIRSRRSEKWLPYEAEAIEKMEKWRSEVGVVRSEIVSELRRLDEVFETPPTEAPKAVPKAGA